MKIITWLNGKKTIIGLVLLQVATLPFVAAHPEITTVLQWVGGIFTGVGFTHRMIKQLLSVSHHFLLCEFVPKEIYAQFKDSSIWYIDPKLIVIAEWMRTEIDKPIKINDWALNGQYNYSGYRPPECAIGAKYSQHRFGRAMDIKVEGMTPKRVFEFIQDNWAHLKELGLTTVENINATPTWNHLDVRWTGKEDLLIVNP